MSAYGDRIYVVEVDLMPGHWTGVSEHGRLEFAVWSASALQVGHTPIPAERIRIREYELSATYRADGTLAIEPNDQHTGGVA